MATRFYFAATELPQNGVAPAFDTAWSSSSQGVRRRLVHNRGGSAISTGGVIDLSGTLALANLDRQYVSDPMTSGIAFATTTGHLVKSYIMASELNATDNVDQHRISIRVFNRAGTSAQTTLLALGNFGTTLEFAVTSLQSRTVVSATTSQPLTQGYTTAAGDRLVVEIGAVNSASGTTPQYFHLWGEGSTGGGDMAENETATSTGLAAWIEFGTAITFEEDARYRSDAPRFVRLNPY